VGYPILKANLTEPKAGMSHQALLLVWAFSMFLMVSFSVTCAAKDTAEFQVLMIDEELENKLHLITMSYPMTIRQSENTGEKAHLLHLRGLPILCSVEDGDDSVRLNSDDWPDEDEEIELIADPFEPLNRAFFQFNDKLYFWFLKPVATGYEKVVPKGIRIGVKNFFSNLSMPVRAVNCLLQGKIDGVGDELARFVVNSCTGMLGFMDPAKQALNINKHDEDFGQTLGFLGFGPGLFINWPVIGPSSIRDTVGLVGDGFLNPLNYAIDTTKYNLAVKGYEGVNQTSLQLGEYEALKKAAVDPYISFREAYHQYRRNKIRE